jgi:RNA polymerase sigma-70 factor, ECF subfamily
MPNPQRYEEFVGLLQHATGRILAYINALLLNWNDAEDVFQETCIVLWQKFDEFQPGTNFTGWAIRIAQNKAMDFQKSRGRRARFFKPELQAVFMADVSAPVVDAAEDGIDALSNCMARLDDGDRRLVQLCYGDGLPVRDVAGQLGRTPQSVHNSLRRIRMALLDCIERAVRRKERQ